MTDIPLADAKAHLSDLVTRAEGGEAVRITRRGKPVVRLVALDTPRAPIDAEALGRLTDSMPAPSEDAAETVRQMRDDARY